MGIATERTEMYVRPHGHLYAADMVKRLMLGVQDFRTRLRERVEAVERGEHTILSRRGKAVAALVPMDWYRRVSEASGEPTEL